MNNDRIVLMNIDRLALLNNKMLAPLNNKRLALMTNVHAPTFIDRLEPTNHESLSNWKSNRLEHMWQAN